MGEDKALLRVGGETLLLRTVRVLAAVTNTILVVGRSQIHTELLPSGSTTPNVQAEVQAIPDLYAHAGPLAGIVTGLAASSSPFAIIVACDMPLLNPDLLRYLLSVADGHDAVVPCAGGMSQPLHAVYARPALAAMEAHLRANQRQVRTVLDDLDVRWVQEDEVRAIDRDLTSFLNVNTAEEWQSAVRRLDR